MNKVAVRERYDGDGSGGESVVTTTTATTATTTAAVAGGLQLCDPGFWPASIADVRTSSGSDGSVVTAADRCPSARQSSAAAAAACEGLAPAAAIHCTAAHFLQRVYSLHPLPPVPAHYKLPELQVPARCFTDYEPRRGGSLREIIVPQHSNWQRDVAFLDKAAVLRSQVRELGYRDVKYVYTSSGVNSTISFLLRVEGLPPATAHPVSNSSSSRPTATRLWVAELQKGFQKYAATHADLSDEDAVDVFLWLHYDRYFPSAAATAGAAGVGAATAPAAATHPTPANYRAPDFSRMVRIALYRWHFECYRTAPVPAGVHLLTLRQRSERILNVAYVVSW